MDCPSLLLTNLQEFGAATYEDCWEIELLFKALKQTLRSRRPPVPAKTPAHSDLDSLARHSAAQYGGPPFGSEAVVVGPGFHCCE